ncbi:MAG: ankyrin repeat domain-containing protein, partial [Planctomycetes bacterium]|nr:ankyrin repeat domain-containing protein [Planctomycetota bacterium]
MEYVQDKEAFIDAVRLGDTDKVAGFLQEQPAIVYARYGLSRNPLHFAIELRHAGVAKLLIATCPALLADTDAAGKKPLEYADQALTSLLSETVAAYEKQAAEPFASVPATTAGGHQRHLNRG